MEKSKFLRLLQFNILMFAQKKNFLLDVIYIDE